MAHPLPPWLILHGQQRQPGTLHHSHPLSQLWFLVLLLTLLFLLQPQRAETLKQRNPLKRRNPLKVADPSHYTDNAVVSAGLAAPRVLKALVKSSTTISISAQIKEEGCEVEM